MCLVWGWVTKSEGWGFDSRSCFHRIWLASRKNATLTPVTVCSLTPGERLHFGRDRFKRHRERNAASPYPTDVLRDSWKQLNFSLFVAQNNFDFYFRSIYALGCRVHCLYQSRKTFLWGRERQRGCERPGPSENQAGNRSEIRTLGVDEKDPSLWERDW